MSALPLTCLLPQAGGSTSLRLSDTQFLHYNGHNHILQGNSGAGNLVCCGAHVSGGPWLWSFPRSNGSSLIQGPNPIGPEYKELLGLVQWPDFTDGKMKALMQ